MRLRLLAAAAALLAFACVKRVAPSAGDDRTTLSGTPVSFGYPGELPSETTVSWDFGDGTPPVAQPSVQHQFPQAGAYTVTQTITDRDGQRRTSTAQVTVLRRAVPAALPADVRAALILQSPWSRVAIHREVASKLSLSGFFDEVSRTVSEGLGFDALDGKAALKNGFDPDEGIAFYTLPQDPEALVFVVGTSDDALSLAAAKRLLAHERGPGKLAGGPFTLADAQLADGTKLLVGTGADGGKVALLQRHGYLYLRLAGASDPLLSLQSAAALPPDKGLAVDPRFLAAMKHVGSGDAVFYSRAAEGEKENRFSSELGASAFAVTDGPDLLRLKLFTQLRNLSGAALAGAFKASKPPPDFAALLPADAAGYLRISAAPQVLWHELTRAAGADATRLRERVQETMGLDLEKDLIPAFTGNLGVAVYLDAGSLIEAVLGEQVGSLDRSTFLAVAELSSKDTMRAALERAMKSRPASDRREVNGALWLRIGDGAQVALKDDLIFLSVGGPPPQPVPEPVKPTKGKKSAAPPALTSAQLGALGQLLLPDAQRQLLGPVLQRSGLRGFEVQGQQAAWLDIAGIARSIERAGAAQGGMASVASRLVAERAAGVRDALLQMHATPDGEGLEADFFVRFPSRAAAPTGGK